MKVIWQFAILEKRSAIEIQYAPVPTITQAALVTKGGQVAGYQKRFLDRIGRRAKIESVNFDICLACPMPPLHAPTFASLHSLRAMLTTGASTVLFAASVIHLSTFSSLSHALEVCPADGPCTSGTKKQPTTPTRPAAPQSAMGTNYTDPRCAQGISCQIYGRQPGMADARDQCGRIGGTWRPGPGGAPFIWCDFPQATGSAYGEASEIGGSAQPTQRESKTDRFARLAAIAELGLQLIESYENSARAAQETQRRIDEAMAETARRMERHKTAEQSVLGEIAEELRLDRERTTQDMMGDLSEARRICGGTPGTRQGLSECFRNLSTAYIRQAALCEDSSQNLSTLGPGQKRGVPIIGSPSVGQRTIFEACADNNERGARTAHCVAVGILRADKQFNPLMKECAQRFGVI